MKNLIFLIIFCALLIPTSCVSAQATPSVVDTTIPVSGEIIDAVNDWLAVNAPMPMPYWVITYVGQRDAETGTTFVSLAALDIADTQAKWHITDDDIVKWMGSVTVDDDKTVEIYSDGGYSEEQGRLGGGKLADTLPVPKLDGGGANYRFPWQSGAMMMYGTRGVHAAGGGGGYATGYSAVDFVGGDDLGSGVASNAVYASSSGSVDYVCADDTTTLVRVTGDEPFIYAHLLDNSTLTENHSYSQGALIGYLKYGSFDDNCGWAEQTAKHYHLHFGFRPSGGVFRLEGCILSMTNESWECGTGTVSTGQFLKGGTGSPGTGDDGGASIVQPNFWDYAIAGFIAIYRDTIVSNMPEHTANQFIYAMYNGISIALRITRILVFSNLNLEHLIQIIVFAWGIKLLLAIVEAIVFLFKVWKSIVPIVGA